MNEQELDVLEAFYKKKDFNYVLSNSLPLHTKYEQVEIDKSARVLEENHLIHTKYDRRPLEDGTPIPVGSKITELGIIKLREYNRL